MSPSRGVSSTSTQEPQVELPHLKKTKLVIPTRNLTRIEDGYTVTGVEGLAILKTLTGSGKWTVIHIGSGATTTLTPLPTRNQARDFLLKIAPLADWTRPLNELKRKAGLLERVGDVAYRVTELEDKTGPRHQPVKAPIAYLKKAFNATEVIDEETLAELDLARQLDWVESWNQTAAGVRRDP